METTTLIAAGLIGKKLFGKTLDEMGNDLASL